MDKELKSVDELNWFGRFIMKSLNFFGLTSGVGLMVLGGFYFLYGVINYIWMSAFVSNATNEITHELYFVQALLGLVCVGIAIMIRELKNLR
jgi:hypothetical protein